MKLYEIDHQIQALFDKLEHGLEVCDSAETTSVEAQLNQLMIDKKAKLESCAKALRNLEAYEEALTNEATDLKYKASVVQKQIDWLRSYIGNSLGTGNELQTSIGTLGWRKSSAVEISDEFLVPEQFWKTKTTREISKTLITDHLKGGGDPIPGASLVEKFNLRIK